MINALYSHRKSALPLLRLAQNALRTRPEINNKPPTPLFSGVLGAISLLLAIFSFQILSVNYVDLILILLAISMFILEVKVHSFGAVACPFPSLLNRILIHVFKSAISRLHLPPRRLALDYFLS